MSLQWYRKYLSVRPGSDGFAGKRALLKTALAGGMTSLLVILLMLGLKVWFDTTILGTQIQEAGYNVLLSGLHKDEADPITIVDIGDLPKQNGVTSREALKKILSAISAKSPAVIGLDIDFGPNGDGYLDPKEDPAFFQFCQDMSYRGERTNRASVPVILGVYRTRELDPEWWLGPKPRYSAMAANIWVDADDTRTVPIWTRVVRGSSTGTKGQSFSYALANKYLQSTAKDHAEVRLAALDEMYRRGDAARFIRRVSVEEQACVTSIPAANQVPCRYQSASVLVDYSKLPQMEDLESVVRWSELVNVTTQKGRTHTQINDLSAARFSALFANKIVLVGNAGDAQQDVFSVPHTRFHLGVFMHACAAATLADRPMWDFTPVGQVLGDLLASIFILVCVTMLRVQAILSTGRDLNGHRLHMIFTAIVVSIIVIQFILINQLRLIWDDFLVVALVLLLHSSAEEGASKVWKWSKTKAWAQMRKFVEAEAEEAGHPEPKAEEA